MIHLADAAKTTAVGAAAMLGLAVCGAATAAADTSKLMAMMPQGFSAANCEEETASGLALEKVNCGQSTDPAGPAGAMFALYANTDDLASGFQNVKRVTVSSSCPGDQQSPGPWGFGTGAKNGGQVECGTVQGDSGATQAVVVWTDNAKLRAAAVRGADISSLYSWWKAKSG